MLFMTVMGMYWIKIMFIISKYFIVTVYSKTWNSFHFLAKKAIWQGNWYKTYQ
jgi:hypothetical protein